MENLLRFAKIILSNVVFQNFLIICNLFQVSPMIKSSLSPDALACLQKYFEAAGVALS